MNDKPQITITVTGCKDCPFLDPHDMDSGYSCNASKSEEAIYPDKMFQPETPDWCPLENIVVLVLKQ